MGNADYITNLGQVDLRKGKWLILSRTKNNLLDIMKDLKRKNIYYQSNKGKSFLVGIYKAALAYSKWQVGEILESTEIEEIKEYIPNAKFWNKNKNWYEVFTAANQQEVMYIRNLLTYKEKLLEPARVYVSTIHAAKGGEEDNVILSLHQSSKVQKGIRLSIDKQDEEHRVWYVGSTRARNNLYMLRAKKKSKEYQL